MDRFEVKDRYTLEDFELLVRRLRDKEDGCPWDKVQTHDSIRQNFIEETYEAVDAIDKRDNLLLKEELGDVLLQVALHAEIAKEENAFDLTEVVNTLCNKLVERHPHIFGSITADTSEKVLSNWEDIKRVEKEQKTATDAINDLPQSLPPLMKTQKVQKRAAYVGYEYSTINSAFSDFVDAVEGLRCALSRNTDYFETIGDLLFFVVNLCRLVDIDASLALEKSTERFIERFKIIEETATSHNIDMKKAGINTLKELYNNKIKKLEELENEHKSTRS